MDTYDANAVNQTPLEASSKTSKTIPVKVVCGDDIRRFNLNANRGLPILLETVAGLYNLPLPAKLDGAGGVAPAAVTSFALKWKDAEGDLVTLASGADVKLALAETPDGAMLRLAVVKTSGPTVAPAPEAAPCAFPAWRRKLFAAAAGVPMNCGKKWGGEGANCPGRRLARFVAHVKPANGAPVPPSSTFKKVWRVRNDAAVPWPAAVSLVYVSGEAGDSMGAPHAVPVPGLLAPGKELDVKVKMTAPAAPGEYEGFWRLSDASGAKFGQRLRAAVVVQDGAKTNKELKKERKEAKQAAKNAAKAGAAAEASTEAETETEESEFEVVNKPGEEENAQQEDKAWPALRTLRSLGFKGKRAKAVCLASGGDVRASLATLSHDNPRKAKKVAEALLRLEEAAPSTSAAAAEAPAPTVVVVNPATEDGGLTEPLLA